MQMPLSDDVVRNPSGMDASGRDSSHYLGFRSRKRAPFNMLSASCAIF